MLRTNLITCVGENKMADLFRKPPESPEQSQRRPGSRNDLPIGAMCVGSLLLASRRHASSQMDRTLFVRFSLPSRLQRARTIIRARSPSFRRVFYSVRRRGDPFGLLFTRPFEVCSLSRILSLFQSHLLESRQTAMYTSLADPFLV